MTVSTDAPLSARQITRRRRADAWRAWTSRIALA